MLRSWLGIVLSTVGVVVLVAGTSAVGEGSLVGDLWIVATVIDWALYNTAVRRISRRAGDTATTAAALRRPHARVGGEERAADGGFVPLKRGDKFQPPHS